MKLRTFLLSILALLSAYWCYQAYAVWWPLYKEIRWQRSPLCQMQKHFALIELTRERAGQKYITTFKDKCKIFGEDMKLLKRIDKDPFFDAPFKEHLKLRLYYQQFILYEQWLVYDRLLFPYGYDLQASLHYYRDIRPRSI